MFQIFGEEKVTEEISKKAQLFYENLSESSLSKYIGSDTRREKILSRHKLIDEKNLRSIIDKLKVSLVLHCEASYPQNLHDIPHTPFLLYVRGEIPVSKMFGVVGTRKMSSYGKKVIEKIVPEVSNIFTIVSGGAAGCDTMAHRTTLSSGNKTIVVIGTGIDETYPMGNSHLYQEIVTGKGALVSIFPINEPGNTYNFPVRNEIVVGLCEGILVVEAQEKSGSMITAALALDIGKDLFSIPGDITLAQSSGTNMLIKKGEAKCVTTPNDILEEYQYLVIESSHKNIIPQLNCDEKSIYDLLSQEEYESNILMEKLGLTSSEISVTLSLLELKKIIKKNMSGKYMLVL